MEEDEWVTKDDLSEKVLGIDKVILIAGTSG